MQHGESEEQAVPTRGLHQGARHELPGGQEGVALQDAHAQGDGGKSGQPDLGPVGWILRGCTFAVPDSLYDAVVRENVFCDV
jgi:hypothetical protein